MERASINGSLAVATPNGGWNILATWYCDFADKHNNVTLCPHLPNQGFVSTEITLNQLNDLLATIEQAQRDKRSAEEVFQRFCKKFLPFKSSIPTP